MNSTSIIKSITEASKVIGNTWPLYTFVASNPLSGYENKSFQEAVSLAQKHLCTHTFPQAEMYRQALEQGNIDANHLKTTLSENGFTEDPDSYLTKMESTSMNYASNDYQQLDRIMAKWLSSFMDEGLAEWELPYKSEGFYNAWRLLVIYDSQTGTTALKDIPKSALETLENLLVDYSEDQTVQIFTNHLAALPGWTGYINHRTKADSDWQREYPVNLTDYLAIRLWTANKLNIPFIVETGEYQSNDNELNYLWLKAWEKSWQDQLLDVLEKESIGVVSVNHEKNIDAQLVFCIDTRSELIRRHVEAAGNYETFGYAGFFGIAMDYKSLEDGISRKSCPPIVGSAYQVEEHPQKDEKKKFVALKKSNKFKSFTDYFLKRMKNMLPSAFGYVEGSGFFYGLGLVGRTLMPSVMYKKVKNSDSDIESVCQPVINKINTEKSEEDNIALEEKIAIVKSAFSLMGWRKFAPLVIFAGHGSHSVNNPFSSSLDCGACAASPGRHNARMLAKLANLPEVRNALSKDHDIHITDETLFLGAEHNTTTDDIIIFDSEAPETHKHFIKKLKNNLLKAQKTAVENRMGFKNQILSKVHNKANNWSETRPEWGLAKNAGFIVGPRSLTKNIDLDSRCFLHSYDWKLDPQGVALEGIMQGPMVVTQWINNHYYFSTIDNNNYGGGSKITHNVTGRFGVVQGNGGDLKMGLPLQSLYETDATLYHQPLRLSVMIQAPISRVSEILAKNENLMQLVDNEWIYLMVMNPEENNKIYKYHKGLNWRICSNEKKPHVSDNIEKQMAVV
ncbi:MAG: DUF2309 domain-containing protein [Nonlabens sp.]